MQRWLHVRARSRIVEPSHISVREQKIQPIGMPVPAARMPVVERDIEIAAVAAKHSDPLRGEQVGFQWQRDELRKVLAREEKGAPREIGARESGRGEIALHI